jgi:hypothetical protein
MLKADTTGKAKSNNHYYLPIGGIADYFFLKEYQGNWYAFVRDQFERNRHISRVNITEIEYMLRLGRKSFDQMKSESCKNVRPKRQLTGIWASHMERQENAAKKV